MTRTVVIAGVGPGLGASIARKFAAEGCAVGLFARSAEFIEDLANELDETPGDALAIPTDVTDPEGVAAGFAASPLARSEVLAPLTPRGRGLRRC